MDLARKVVTPLGVTAVSPVWSPSGEYIAYIATPSNAIHVIRPDGTGVRAVTRGPGFGRGISWSPDGKYLVASRGAEAVTVIDAATGEEMPVRLRALDHGLRSPSWKP